MPFFFWKSQGLETPANSDPSAAQTLRLTANQQRTLDAIRRYEAKVLPRLRDAKRSPKKSLDAAGLKRFDEFQEHVMKARRDAQRVRGRFTVTLPETVIKEIERQKATKVELKAIDAQRLSLTLSKPSPNNPRASINIGTFEVVPVRQTPDGGRPAGGDAPVKLETRDAKPDLVVPARKVPSRLREKSGMNQGEVQYQLHQLRKNANQRMKLQSNVSSAQTKPVSHTQAGGQ